MVQLLILHYPHVSAGSCAVCARPMEAAAGPGFVAADSLDVVCDECGRRCAPTLAALLRLAQTATRVGRMTRHTLVPPLPALLDLARAAEDYAHAVTEKRRQAA
jgi:hypothetical protein